VLNSEPKPIAQNFLALRYRFTLWTFSFKLNSRLIVAGERVQFKIAFFDCGQKGKKGWRVRMSKKEKREFASFIPRVSFPAL
jgi:hypothetical protein